MPVTAPIAVPIPQPSAFMRPMLTPISCAATRFSATARMAIPVGLKRKNAKRTVIKTSVTRKISAFSWLTLREGDDPGRLEDQDDAERGERVQAAEREPVDEQLSPREIGEDVRCD